MSVTSVDPFACTQGGVDNEGNTTYTSVYYVWTDDKDDGPDTARGADAVSFGLPDYNDPFSWGNDSNAYSLAKSRNAELAEIDEVRPFYRKWSVTIGYTTAGVSRDSSGGGGSGSGSDEGIQDPVDEQWQISGSYVQTLERTSVDKDGTRMTNSAEEERHTDIPSGYDTLILEGNTTAISLPTRSAAKMKCNSTAMWGLPARQVFLAQWVYRILYRGTTAYVSHRLEWWIADPDKLWDFVFIDSGTRELVEPLLEDPAFRYRPAMSRDTPTTVFLDGTGLALDMTDPANADGVEIRKEVIKEYDFLGNLTFLTDPLPGPFT